MRKSAAGDLLAARKLAQALKHRKRRFFVCRSDEDKDKLLDILDEFTDNCRKTGELKHLWELTSDLSSIIYSYYSWRQIYDDYPPTAINFLCVHIREMAERAATGNVIETYD